MGADDQRPSIWATTTSLGKGESRAK
jgi:hypothetical protein